MSRARAWFASLLLSTVPAWAATPTASVPLAQVLRELSDPRLQFVFSSRLVPDSLRIDVGADALRARGPDVLQSLATALAPLGLGLARVAPGIYAIVARAVPAAAPAPAPSPTAAQDETLREVVVAASRFRVADPTASIARVDAAELALEVTPGNDPLRAVARLPGIVQDGISARSHVRGGEQDEELLLLDGYPLRSPFHLAGYQSLFSVVDSGLIRSMDVYTGGFPARYGNRMSAVFDIHTFDAGELPAHTLSADSVNATARYAGTPLMGIETIANVRIGTLSPLLEAFAPHVGRPRYGDAYLTAARTFDDGIRVSANVLWSRDELTISDDRRRESAEMDGSLHYAWIHARSPLWSGATGEVWVGQSVIVSEREGSLATPGIATGQVDDARNSTLWDVRTRLAWEVGARHFVEGGIDAIKESGHYDYTASATYPSDVAALFGRPLSYMRDEVLDPERHRVSLYFTHRWQLPRDLTLEWGARGESLVTSGIETRWDVDPRLGLRWEPRPGTRLSFNWGRYLQTDEIQELKIEDGLTHFPAPQRSEHLILGLDLAPDDDTAVRAAAFVKRQSDPRARFENVFNRRTILPELGPDRVEVLPTDSEIHGVELSGERRWGPWQLAVNTGWSEALDEGPDTGYGTHTRRSWDVGWELGVWGTWRAGPWTVTSGIARRPGFPTTALLHDAAGYALGERNGIRLPRYIEWDLKTQYVQATARGVLQYSAQVTNLLNASNDCCTELLRDAGGGLELRRLRGLPLLPSLGIRWSW